MKNSEHDSTQDSSSDSPSNQSRRSFLKTTGATVLAAPAILTSRKSGAQVLVPSLPPSPPTTPWQEELPAVIEPLSQTDLFAGPLPPPQGDANTDAGECGRERHQRWDEFFGAPVLQPGEADLYELKVEAITDHVFHPDYPPQLVWNYVGRTESGAPHLNPTIFARYGRPIIVRLHNELPEDHGSNNTALTGFGSPEISMHLHNLHMASESDGFPGDFFSRTKKGPTLDAPGRFKDHLYLNVYAGLDEFGGIGDSREALGTLWYHDHTQDFTAPNAARGISAFYLLFDELDSGDEQDGNPNALRLPSHPYDYPLVFKDLRFNAKGIHIFDQLDSEGTLGDKIVVNGKIEPVLRVARRKYRLRLLDAGPSRFYQFHLVNAANVVQRFTYIANDGNFLRRPLLNQTRIRLAVAERADIVVDFSQYALGTELYLVNRLEQDDTRGPDDVKAPGKRVLKFIVDREPSEPDVSRVPSFLRPLRRPTAAEIAAARVRRWSFTRKNGMWAINDRFMNPNTARVTITKGSAEIWDLINSSGGWSHPIHIHLEEGIILNKFVSGNEVPVPAHERGRKDVFVLGPNSRMRVFIRFRDFVGKYVMHCHNTIHEDHAMMVRFDVGED
ncbi:Tat (twin-arginine translocation) pathway signal sequence [Nitrosomonas sp. Nm166]|nr:Tat (twin-arginine translocation) pathway signal sequence [Nitrosomonas sp. Nm166]